MQTLFGQFVVVMMLALIPAYVLGRFLPSDASMTGPFRGFTVSFRDSFALYLVILLAGGGMIFDLSQASTTQRGRVRSWS